MQGGERKRLVTVHPQAWHAAARRFPFGQKGGIFLGSRLAERKALQPLFSWILTILERQTKSGIRTMPLEQQARANTKAKPFQALVTGNKGLDFKIGVSPTAAINVAAQLAQIGIWLPMAKRTLDPAFGRQIQLDALFFPCQGRQSMLMKAVGRLSHRLSFERLAGGGVEAWDRTAVLREDESSSTVT